MSEALLKSLGLTPDHAGTWSGQGGWLDDRNAPLIESINPTTGAVLGRVRATTQAQYEQVMASAVAAAQLWRNVPAPKRGEVVRQLGDGAARSTRRSSAPGRRSRWARSRPRARARCRR